MTKASKSNRLLAASHVAEATFVAERLIATGTALFLVVVVVFLVVRNEPFADPNLVVAFRIVLSLGIGILGGTIAGFLNVSYSVRGRAFAPGERWLYSSSCTSHLRLSRYFVCRRARLSATVWLSNRRNQTPLHLLL